MQARLLLGPAGSGKTFRCLAEIREALDSAPVGPPLLLVAPKQTTFQLERELLAEPSLAGYTRLQILSFDRLALFLLEQLGKPLPGLLDEEGRVMVLRALLASKRQRLKLFRASARLTGFARQLSLMLRELQHAQLTPASLDELSAKLRGQTLAYKLNDLATLLHEYLDWLKTRGLQDSDTLLPAAVEALTACGQARPDGIGETSGSSASQEQLWMDGFAPAASRRRVRNRQPERTESLAAPPRALGPIPTIEQLWVDGFAEFSEAESALLAALLPFCRRATITFCLDRVPMERSSWLSCWTSVRRSYDQFRQKLTAITGVQALTELLPRTSVSRFASNPILAQLEAKWGEPTFRREAPPVAVSGFQTASNSDGTISPGELSKNLRVAICADPQAEAVFAAREILGYVRAGGRFREITVSVRNLETYSDSVQRIFSRYQIPFFLDRRESMSHHPLPELTRNALRTIAFGWSHEDWFAALKTGLVSASEGEIDRLENEALARGWKGATWQKPLTIPEVPDLTAWLGDLQNRLFPPFQHLAVALSVNQNRPSGLHLATALRQFWTELGIEQRLGEWSDGTECGTLNPVHATVLAEMTKLLDNMELAFGTETLTLREWLPILEAGLANVTVGIIPPALDQVLIGAVDRSRNPNVKLALILGLNETVFPAPAQSTVLLNDMDRSELEKTGVLLHSNARQQIGRERFLAYLAFTRPRERLILTCAQQDITGSPLNPSPFLGQVQRLFPGLIFEVLPSRTPWMQSQHVTELIPAMLDSRRAEMGHEAEELARLPSIAGVLERLHPFEPFQTQTLPPEVAASLYGPVLRSSVSRLEQFAACPFKFLVHSGLRAEERRTFELDIKEQGTFQHDVLAEFHERLRQEGKHWRDITPPEARERMARLCEELAGRYRSGLLQANEQTRFLTRVMTESLQDFVETTVSWMRGQYQFDPVAVELPFGDKTGRAWELDLGNGHGLLLQGRIDRVDLSRNAGHGPAHCVVVDYKSGQRQLDPILIANGIQLQLLTYLNIVRRWPNPEASFGPNQLLPAGVFYVGLRGKYNREQNRVDALTDTQASRQLAYRHTGRFSTDVLPLLDSRPNAAEGNQFNYRRTGAGRIHKSCREVLAATDFTALLDSVETIVKEMGRRIFSGSAEVAPYRKRSSTACDQCDYRAICRIDRWTHQFRILTKEQTP